MIGRNEIIRRIAIKKYGTKNNVGEFELKEISQFCDYLVDVFIDSLLSEEKIVWKGFLSAEVVERRERKGRHPLTNEVVTFPPIKTINCKMSKSIKDAVNDKRE